MSPSPSSPPVAATLGSEPDTMMVKDCMSGVMVMVPPFSTSTPLNVTVTSAKVYPDLSLQETVGVPTEREKGVVKVGAKARVFRRGELIFNGEVRSLRRFQDDVREVKQGLECGIKLDNFADFDVNDVIQIYDIELKKASL